MPDPFKQVKIIELMELFDDEEVTTADKIDRPERAIERQAIDDFMERNPLAGGGMLVEPGFGGVRQGYKGKNLDRAAYKEIRPITQANIDNYTYFTSKEAAKPYKFKVQLPGGTEVFKTRKEAQAAIDAAPITNRDYTEGLIDFKIPKGATNYDKGRIKIPTGEFIGEGRDKSQIFKIQNKDGSNVKYMASGTGEGKKFYNSIEEIKKAKLKSLPDELVKVSSKIIKEGISEVTYKNKKTGKIVKYYKPRVGESKETIPGKGTTSLKKAEKFIKDYYVRNPKPVRDPQKSYATKDRRNVALQETDTTKATGTKKYNYHHIRQIAGGVPLTSDDVAIINQRINSKIGGEFNETLNRISAAIQKNNRLALEAMNAKEEGLALEYMKRSDDLNAQAEKIVNSAIDKLPKKYKGYVGFNQFTLPRDEYGLPIRNEPMIIRKVGGMPVSKDAIDLTTLDRKDAATFRKIVKQQAERGKIGKIDVSSLLLKLAAKVDPDGCGRKASASGGRIGFKSGTDVCLTKAKNYMTEELKKGIGTEPNARTSLIKRIISGTANFLKQNLSPKELLKAENLIGKPALYGALAFETAYIGDSVIRKGQPLNVATAESLVGDILNLDANVARAKNLLKSNVQISPAAKQYAQNIIDYDTFQKNQLGPVQSAIAKKLPGSDKYFKMQKDLENKITQSSDAGRFDYEKAVDEIDATQMAKKEYSPFFSKLGTPLEGRLIKRPGTRVGPRVMRRDFKMDLSPITYENFKPDIASKEQVDDFLKATKVIPEDRELLQEFYEKQFVKPAELEQLMELPSFRGTQFAGGGIAKEAGDRSGAMLESMNPDSQGLSGLLKRGNKI